MKLRNLSIMKLRNLSSIEIVFMKITNDMMTEDASFHDIINKFSYKNNIVDWIW